MVAASQVDRRRALGSDSACLDGNFLDARHLCWLALQFLIGSVLSVILWTTGAVKAPKLDINTVCGLLCCGTVCTLHSGQLRQGGSSTLTASGYLKPAVQLSSANDGLLISVNVHQQCCRDNAKAITCRHKPRQPEAASLFNCLCLC